MTNALAKLDKARIMLAECRTLPEVKRIRDIAEAAKVYAKAANIGREAQNDAGEIALLAACKAGEILEQLERGKTGPKKLSATVAGNSEYRQTLVDTKTPERTARHWQKMAAIPEKKRTEYIAAVKQSPMGEITAAGLLAAAPVRRKKPRPRSIGASPVLRTVIQGSAFAIPLRDESVQMVMTSPPYFGLRSYEGNSADAFGREKTVVEYVEHSIQVLREIRRVLRNDGVCFWNIADSYRQDKNLLLVPERIAIAAQDDGWILRSAIIWHKTNCVPESVQDRPTACYEYVLMLVKNKKYFWNSAEAVEPSATAGNGFHVPVKKRGGKYGELKLSPPIGNVKHQALNIGTLEGNRTPLLDTRHIRNVWSIPTTTHSESHVAIFPEALAERAIRCGSEEGDIVFDPFAGSGTAGLVAKMLKRNFILMDISEEYCDLMQSRSALTRVGDIPRVPVKKVAAS